MSYDKEYNEELLKSGIEKLDDALGFFMEMKSEQGQFMTHVLKSLLDYCELIHAKHN